MDRIPNSPDASATRLKSQPWDPHDARRTVRGLLRLALDALRLMIEASYWGVAVSLGIQLLTAVGIGLALLLVRRVVTDLTGGTAGHESAMLLPALLALGGALALNAVLTALQRNVQTLLSEQVAWHTVERLLDTATQVELAAFDKPAFYERLERAQAGHRALLLSQSVSALLSATLMTVSILLVLLALQPVLLAVLLVALVPLGLINGVASRERHSLAVLLIQNERKRNYVRRVLTGREDAKEVRSLGTAPFVRGLIWELFEERMRYIRRFLRRESLLALLVGVTDAAAVTGAVALLVYLVRAGGMSLASATAAIAAIVHLAVMLSNVTTAAGDLFEAARCIEDHRAFCEQSVARLPRPGPASREFSRLVVDRVTFAYPGSERPALEDEVSMEVRRGEVVALVGSNGSGKTTLAKFLCRLYMPHAEVDFERLRLSIAVVFQDFGRYLFTAGQNIGLGRVDRVHDHAGIVAAGAGVPGRRRHLARPVAAHRPGSDLLPRRAFHHPRRADGIARRARRARAVREHPDTVHRLLISHRFSTISTTDRIYVLDGGQVDEHGTYADLMRRGGIYADLYRLQAARHLAPASIGGSG